MDIIFFSEYFIKTGFFLSEKTYLPAREREIETIFSMGNGYIGTRNSLEEFYPQSSPGTFLAGFYEKDIDEEFNILVKLPDWTRIKIFIEDEQLDLRDEIPLYHRRYIDLENGCAVREWKCIDKIGRISSIKIIKFISMANKHELGKCLLIKPENYTGKLKVVSGIDCNTADFNYLINQNLNIKNFAGVHMKSKFSDKEFIMLQKSAFLQLEALYQQLSMPSFEYESSSNFSGSFEEWNWLAEVGKTYIINSLTTVYSNVEIENPGKSAEQYFLNTGSDFFKIGAQNHVKRWINRWKESEIKIFGCEYDQKLIDFALYHLIISGEFSGDKYSIPARNLSGESYKGHVFWDTEMYLLPFFTYTKPEIARNLLLYRYNTLGGARKNALQEGFKGASYAWESTDSGLESAPAHVVLPDGNVIFILSGQYENHISSDIAYAVWRYWQATGDTEFLVNYGAEMIFETARFCESLIKLENDGFYHIPSVIGPDEYHEKVNDNAYTNYLAKFNFEIALKTFDFLEKSYSEELLTLKKKIKLKNSELENWKHYANNIYSGYDQKTKLFEQFKGYYNLEFIDLNQFEPRTVPMDIILGREKTQKTQVIKQADVLMFMFLFGENFSNEQVLANYEFYKPRTGHGSSLSPSIHSIIASRIGKSEEAYKYFLKNARIDLDDEFGNASGGIHIAAAGGVWMSVVMGFAGMYPTDKGLIFDPHMPEKWKSIEFSVKWHGQNLKISLNTKKIMFSLFGNKNILISLGKNNWKNIETNKLYIGTIDNGVWNWKDDLS